MKVALVHLRHAASGGTERYLNELARFLAERGDEVTIVCRRHGAPPHPRVRFERLHGLALGAAARLWSFARAVERHVAGARYDVVYGLGRTWTHDVIRLGGGCHQTYLELAHAASLSAWERRLGLGAAKHRAALELERRALAPGAYRLVVVNSALVGRDVAARHGVAQGDLRLIHNGVDLERFHPRLRASSGAALRRELGLGAGEFVVLFLGNGYGRKGLDRLLEVWPEALARRPDARLVVVGADSQQAAYERRAGATAHGVRFLGPRADVEACYAASDLYVLPTRYDPFANSTLEALASGLPVVTTAANGGSELIGPQQGSTLAEEGLSAALARELGAWIDPERARAGGASARAVAEQHPLADKLRQSVRVLEEAAALAAAR